MTPASTVDTGDASPRPVVTPTAEEHIVSIRPVVQAIEEYVPGQSIEEVAVDYGLDVKSVIKMGSNENAAGPPPAAVAAISSEFDSLHLYPKKGFTDFKRVIAEHHALQIGNIVLGNGSESLITTVPHLYVDPGDEVVVPAECYPLYESASRISGATVKRVPLRDFRYSIDDTLKAVTERTKIVWVCNPMNPTGTMLNVRDLDRLVGELPATVAVVVDEAYADYVDDPDYGEAIAHVKRGLPNVIVVRTLSKAYGLAGLRIGYLVAHSVVCGFFDRVREPFCISRPATAAGCIALEDREWLRSCREWNRRGRAYLTEELTRLGFNVVPSAANFVFAQVPRNANEVSLRLLERGIIVRSGVKFGYPNHIRITVGTEDQNHRLIAELEEILPEHCA